MKYTTGSGQKVSKRALESGRAKMERVTSANGNRVTFRVVGFTYGRTGINMKASGTTRLSMDMALIFLQMEIHFKGCIVRVSQMAKETISGEMGHPILVSLKMHSNTVKESGKKIRDRIAIITLVIFVVT